MVTVVMNILHQGVLMHFYGFELGGEIKKTLSKIRYEKRQKHKSNLIRLSDFRARVQKATFKA